VNDKKWFIYVTNHHEGPFTVEEVVTQTLSGVYSKQSFVWCQGMPDWVPMSTIPEFIATLSARTKTGISMPPLTPPPSAVEPIEVSTSHQYQTVQAPVERTRTSIIEKQELTGEIIRKEEVPMSPDEEEKVQANVEGFLKEQQLAIRKRRLAGLGFFGVLGFGIGLFVYSGYFDLVADRLRSKLITIPQLSDVDGAEYAELVAAVKASPTLGPKVAVAVSRADSLAPALYVTSNLPAGISYELFVEGIPQTLLNTLSSSAQVKVTVEGKFAKSAALKLPESGGVLPRGEYYLYVVEAPVGHSREAMTFLSKLVPLQYEAPDNIPTGRKIFYTKKIFLGGRDESYHTRLREYHERLLARSKGEREELKQTIANLQQQLAYIQGEYDRLKRQRLGSLQVKAWNNTADVFNKNQSSINSRVNTQMNQDVKAVFHLDLYQRLQPILSNLDGIFRSMGSYFKGGVAFSEIDLRIEPLKAAWIKEVNALEAILSDLDAKPTDATGLPRKGI